MVLASLSFRAVASERAKAINLVIIRWQYVNFHHALYRRAISPCQVLFVTVKIDNFSLTAKLVKFSWDQRHPSAHNAYYYHLYLYNNVCNDVACVTHTICSDVCAGTGCIKKCKS